MTWVLLWSTLVYFMRLLLFMHLEQLTICNEAPAPYQLGTLEGNNLVSFVDSDLLFLPFRRISFKDSHVDEYTKPTGRKYHNLWFPFTKVRTKPRHHNIQAMSILLYGLHR